MLDGEGVALPETVEEAVAVLLDDMEALSVAVFVTDCVELGVGTVDPVPVCEPDRVGV